MMHILIALLIVCVSAIAQPEDPCRCVGTDLSSQYRAKAKHRKSYTGYQRADRTIAAAEIFGWQARYADKTDTVDRSASAAKLRRLRNSPEDTLYTLKGYLYYIKKEEDCDYHMEIGPLDPAEPRAVAELTKEFCGEQRKVREYIIGYTAKSKKKVLKEHNLKEKFDPPIPVPVLGLGFYDGWHTPGTHGRKYTRGSSWELHPAVRVEFGH